MTSPSTTSPISNNLIKPTTTTATTATSPIKSSIELIQSQLTNKSLNHHHHHDLIDHLIQPQIKSNLNSNNNNISSSFLDSRPNSSNGRTSHLNETSPNSSMGSSNAPPPYYQSYNNHQHQSSYSNNQHPPLHSPDTRTQLFVGNLPFRVRWQDLKDLFRKAGTVLRADVCLTPDNRSKGFGTVLYANRYDALKAIDIYNGFSWQTRTLDVRLDQQDPTGALAMNSISSTVPIKPIQRMGTHTLTPTNQTFHSSLRSAGRPLPPTTNWPPGFQVPQPNSSSNLSSLDRPTSIDGSAQPAAPASSLKPTIPEHLLQPPPLEPPNLNNSDSIGIRLAHQQHQSTQSLTCADLIRSSSARLSDDTNKLSSSLPQPPPRRSSAVSAHAQHVLDAMRPAFQPLSHSLENPAQATGAHTVMKELAKIPTDSDDITTSLSEPGLDDDRPTSIHSQHSSNPVVPSIVYPYYASSSTPMSSAGSSGLANPHSGKQSQTATGINASARHLFVGNLPFNCQWQDLKDLFRNAGNILRADVAMGIDGRSRGFGTVLFATMDDAKNAVRMYDGHEFNGRVLKVHFDKFSHPSVNNGSASADHSPRSQAAPQPAYLYSSIHPSDQHRQPGVSHPYKNVSGYNNYTNYAPPSAPLDSKRMHNSPYAFESSLPSPHGPNIPSTSFQGQFPSLPQSGPKQQTGSFYPPSHLDIGPFSTDPSFGNQSMLHPDSQMPGPDLWAPDHVSANSSFHNRGLSAPPGLPLSPIASRRSSFLKTDPSPENQQDSQQMPAVQPIGHPNADTTRPNSIPMPPPYDLAAGGMASPSIPRGIQMTPSMPAFSFQPFPATPPLLPNFFSPGIGPSTPPASSRSRAQNRNNGGFHSFGAIPTSVVHPPTPMNLRNSNHPSMEYNPMFPPSMEHMNSNIPVGLYPHQTAPTGFENESSAGEASHDGAGKVNGLAILHAPQSTSTDPISGDGDHKNSSGHAHHQPDPSLGTDSNVRARSRGLAASENGPRPTSPDRVGRRRMTGIFEPVDELKPTDHLTPLSNVDWGYSPSGVNSNRRASFFVSPSHFNSQESQHGLGIGSSTTQYGPGDDQKDEEGLELTKEWEVSRTELEQGNHHEELKLERQINQKNLDETLIGSNRFKKEEEGLNLTNPKAKVDLNFHHGISDEGLKRWRKKLIKEDGSNRRASFDLSSLENRSNLATHHQSSSASKVWMSSSTKEISISSSSRLGKVECCGDLDGDGDGNGDGDGLEEGLITPITKQIERLIVDDGEI